MMHFKCGLRLVEDLETEKQISKADARNWRRLIRFCCAPATSCIISSNGR